MERRSGDAFSVCFNSMKIKYTDYDESLKFKNFLVPEDKVNVFINFESVLMLLSRIPDLEKKIILERDFSTIMVSNIINLIAHYRGFFVSNGLDTKVYVYMTGFNSLQFPQNKYIDDYRSYYIVKWTENPKFIQLSENLRRTILPLVKTYLEFIPNCYFIDTENIEGSLVPYVIAKSDDKRKNLIVSGDIFDSQYSLMDNFVIHYIHRGMQRTYIASTPAEFLKGILKKDDNAIADDMKKVFGYYPFFISLLSVLGDKSRSIEGIVGVKTTTLFKMITEAITGSKIQAITESPILISEIFDKDDDRKEEFENNFRATSIKMGYDEITDADITSILNQRVDRLDINSLVNLNNTVFAKYPLILERLL